MSDAFYAVDLEVHYLIISYTATKSDFANVALRPEAPGGFTSFDQGIPQPVMCSNFSPQHSQDTDLPNAVSRL